jgi:hypothetical protein
MERAVGTNRRRGVQHESDGASMATTGILLERVRSLRVRNGMKEMKEWDGKCIEKGTPRMTQQWKRDRDRQGE